MRTAWVSSLSVVHYRGNDYSVPTEFGHREVLFDGLRARGGDRVRQSDPRAAREKPRPRRAGLRSAALSGAAGAEDLARWSRRRRWDRGLPPYFAGC